VCCLVAKEEVGAVEKAIQEKWPGTPYQLVVPNEMTHLPDSSKVWVIGKDAKQEDFANEYAFQLLCQ
jgi:hypothetical protein